MTEFKNPFENFTEPTGFYAGKTLTVTQAKAEVRQFTWDGNTVTKNALVLYGILDGEDVERKIEEYSVGSFIATADGEGFTKPDGTPGTFHSNSYIHKFIDYAKKGGYDFTGLWDPATGRQYFSRMRGARFILTDEPKKDKDGNPKKNKKGYAEFRTYPGKYLGNKEGAGVPTQASAEVAEKAKALVVGLLTENGGTLTQVDLVRALGSKLNGDADRLAIVSLVTKPDFHSGAPWKRDGSTLTL